MIATDFLPVYEKISALYWLFFFYKPDLHIQLPVLNICIPI